MAVSEQPGQDDWVPQPVRRMLDPALGPALEPIRSEIFGLARFDLSNRQIDFNPIGPAPDGMAGIEVTPDKKWAYTVVANGLHGKKRCEFWAFDLTTDKITQKERMLPRIKAVDRTMSADPSATAFKPVAAHADLARRVVKQRTQRS